MWSQFKTVLLWLLAPLLVWLLAFPNGTGGYQVELVRTPFSGGTVVCTRTGEDVGATFQVDCTCTFGAIETKKNGEGLLDLQIYAPADEDGEDLAMRAYKISYTCEIEGNPPLLIRGQDFTVNVFLRFDEPAPPGAYTVALHTMRSANDAVFEDALIVSPAA